MLSSGGSRDENQHAVAIIGAARINENMGGSGENQHQCPPTFQD